MLLACVPFVFYFNPHWRWVFVVALSRAQLPNSGGPRDTVVARNGRAAR